MGRLTDWRSRLLSYLVAERAAPFEYGSHDCALFAAGAVAAMTGVDYAAPYRGHYRTLLGGLRALHRDGYEDHVALAAAHLEAVHPAYAAPGDLAAIPGGTDGLSALGVVQGAAVYVLMPDGGVGLVSRTTAAKAFRV